MKHLLAKLVKKKAKLIFFFYNFVTFIGLFSICLRACGYMV